MKEIYERKEDNIYYNLFKLSIKLGKHKIILIKVV